MNQAMGVKDYLQFTFVSALRYCRGRVREIHLGARRWGCRHLAYVQSRKARREAQELGLRNRQKRYT